LLIALLPVLRNVQVSDTTGDATKRHTPKPKIKKQPLRLLDIKNMIFKINNPQAFPATAPMPSPTDHHWALYHAIRGGLP
jgi:hypothetical protein